MKEIIHNLGIEELNALSTVSIKRLVLIKYQCIQNGLSVQNVTNFMLGTIQNATVISNAQMFSTQIIQIKIKGM